MEMDFVEREERLATGFGHQSNPPQLAWNPNRLHCAVSRRISSQNFGPPPNTCAYCTADACSPSSLVAV